MRFDKKRKQLFLLLIVLVFASFACNFPWDNGETAAPRATIAVDTEEIENLERDMESAATQAAETGRVEVTLTEAQLTSLLAVGLEQQDRVPLRNPQVYLQGGIVEVQGDLEQGGILVPITVAIEVMPDGRGGAHFQAVSGNLGPLPIPDALLDEISNQLNRNLSPRVAQGVYIEEISVGSGVMTITGTAQ